MNESAPQIKQTDVFKSMLKKWQPYLDVNEQLSTGQKEMVDNTPAAFNLLRKFHREYGVVPDSWESIGFPAGARFAFINDDGEIKEGISCVNPTDFINQLKEFHELGDLQTTAEKRKAELQALIKSRMPAPPPAAPTPPPSTSPFRFRK